jgi:hypothetical protein
MRNLTNALAVLAILILTAPVAPAQSKAVKEDDRGSMVIVFKDGRQQSIRLADVARIEFTPATTGASVVGRARFLGDWKVGDGLGRSFVITLKPGGVARKTLGEKSTGTWKVVRGEAQVSWDDGWHDVIRKVGNKYEKVAFSPDKSLSEEPSNVTDAEYTEPH